MPEVVTQNIDLIQQLSYLGAFLFMTFSGHVILVPQDIALMTVGYLSALGYLKIVPAVILGILAPVTSDIILYFLASKGSRFAPDPEKYSHTWIHRFARKNMHERTILTVFVMRFITGFRFLSPVIGAYIKVPFKKYIFANFISAIIFGTTIVLLGYTFDDQITKVIDLLKSFRYMGQIVFALAVLIVIGVFVKNMYNIRINNAKK